ncbi:MAG: hypothetical protein NTY53_20800, partial [Kiritimatiellaeota bacterium]|nr:hypothetical protein [Kiritimatiellota bacterium]
DAMRKDVAAHAKRADSQRLCAELARSLRLNSMTTRIDQAAARVGEPRIAIEALLKDTARNRFDERGINLGGPCPYLPGNGGLLYAIAMMAAGWSGAPNKPVPGFPDDGSWTVKWEGLKPAL